MDKDIEKVLQEFEEKFCFEELGKKKLYTNKDQTDDIKSFLRQALEAEKAKREEMAREMIGEKIKFPYFLETYNDKDEAFDKGKDTKRQELIKIAKKYGVEV